MVIIIASFGKSASLSTVLFIEMVSPMPVEPRAGIKLIAICKTLIGSHTHEWCDVVLW